MASNSARFLRLSSKAQERAFRITKRLGLLAAGVAAMIASAAAAAPLDVAVVEGFNGNSSSIGFMDYVHPGQVIRLGPRETLVLSYETSCVRETITGGIVTIGSDWSEVQSGQVMRTRGQCGVGKMVLTGMQTSIGGRSFRGPNH
jgi:hypothetical protein